VSELRIEYDDQPDGVIDKVNAALKPLGLSFEYGDGGDGFVAYQLRVSDPHAEAERLRDAVRQHRDERGDDRCHADDGRLYAVLPEGDTRPARETAVTLENCAKYIECRQTGREYVSPQRRIEELEAEVGRLKALCESLAARCHAQSEALAARAEAGHRVVSEGGTFVTFPPGVCGEGMTMGTPHERPRRYAGHGRYRGREEPPPAPEGGGPDFATVWFYASPVAAVLAVELLLWLARR
jgi:hypothetical protein